MREAPFLDGNKLKRLVKFFSAFLAVLAGLLTVHYPVLPEKVLPLYRVDHLEALSLGEFLSALAFLGRSRSNVALRVESCPTSRCGRSETAIGSWRSFLASGRLRLLHPFHSCACVRTSSLRNLKGARARNHGSFRKRYAG